MRPAMLPTRDGELCARDAQVLTRTTFIGFPLHRRTSWLVRISTLRLLYLLALMSFAIRTSTPPRMGAQPGPRQRSLSARSMSPKGYSKNCKATSNVNPQDIRLVLDHDMPRWLCVRLANTRSDRLVAQLYLGAGGGNRTHTLLPEPDFESGASTSSATPASCIWLVTRAFCEWARFTRSPIRGRAV